MKLILQRHWKTDKKRKENGYALLNGSQGNLHIKGYISKNNFDEPTLNKLKKKGFELSKEYDRIDEVWCSALFRTMETTMGIMAGYKENSAAKIYTGNLEFESIPKQIHLINERDYGKLVSGIGHGIHQDDFYLKVAPEKDFLNGISVEKMRSLFPDECSRIKTDNVLDHLNAIITPDGSGVRKVAVITNYSNLVNAGIEHTDNIADRITEFEDGILNYAKNQGVKNKTILIGSHGDVMSTWLKKVENDTVNRYSKNTHNTLAKWDSDNSNLKWGSYRVFNYLEHICIELNEK